MSLPQPQDRKSSTLWQLHRIDPKVPVEESLAPGRQKEGKIRHVGLQRSEGR